MGRRTDETGQRDLAVLQLAQVAGEPNAGHEVLLALLVDQLADVLRDVHRVGARRLVARVAPGLVRLAGLGVWALEVERLGRRLVAEALALEVRGDRKDLQPVPLGQIDALLGVGGGPGVRVALAQVELPAGLLPAVEAGVLDELQPLAFGDIPELSADEADLVVRAFAEAVLSGLLEAHGRVLVSAADRVGLVESVHRRFAGASAQGRAPRMAATAAARRAGSASRASRTDRADRAFASASAAAAASNPWRAPVMT